MTTQAEKRREHNEERREQTEERCMTGKPFFLLAPSAALSFALNRSECHTFFCSQEILSETM